MAKQPSKAAIQLAAITGQFPQFLKNNPGAKIVQLGKPTGKKYHVIDRPWEDDSVGFLIPGNAAKRAQFAAAMEALILPQRLSALYHLDRKEVEVIFTARKVSAALTALKGRKFDFHFRGKQFECEFTKSSDRLLVLAEHAVYPQNSDTSYRNLQTFSQYVAMNEPEGKKLKKAIGDQFDEPLSFFVRNIDWEEEATIEILRHVSFYLTYYDTKSPYILIWPPSEPSSVNARVRYINGTGFPASINSRELNPSLLAFWYAAFEADPDAKFLFYYRIIEFVSSYYLKNDKLRKVTRILTAPDLASRVDGAIDDLVALIREDKPDTFQRFQSVVTELADRQAVWNEICENPHAFTQELDFDGGFKLAKLLEDTSDISKLSPAVLTTIASNFIYIRNALAHGGEAQAGKLILPTARNLKLLLPWVHLITTVAGQVVLFEHHT